MKLPISGVTYFKFSDQSQDRIEVCSTGHMKYYNYPQGAGLYLFYDYKCSKCRAKEKDET